MTNNQQIKIQSKNHSFFFVVITSVAFVYFFATRESLDCYDVQKYLDFCSFKTSECSYVCASYSNICCQFISTSISEQESHQHGCLSISQKKKKKNCQHENCEISFSIIHLLSHEFKFLFFYFCMTNAFRLTHFIFKIFSLVTITFILVFFLVGVFICLFLNIYLEIEF